MSINLGKLFYPALKGSYFSSLKKDKKKTCILKLYGKNKKFKKLLYPGKNFFYVLKLKFFTMHSNLHSYINKSTIFIFTKMWNCRFKYNLPLNTLQNYNWLFFLLKISNLLYIKTDLYSFVKNLKFLRSDVYSEKFDIEYYTYILKLRTSKIYTSKIEESRENILPLLKKKLFVTLYNLSCKKKNGSFNLKLKSIVSNNKTLKKCFQEYINLNSRYMNVKLESLQQHLHYKNFSTYKKKVFFFSSILLNRLSVGGGKYEANYKKRLYFRLKKNKIFLLELCPVLFTNFKLYRIKFMKQKKEYKYVLFHVLDKKYKKIKKNEKKKMKKSRKFWVLSKLYYARRRFYFKFYVPRHIEINYKTQNFLHLNYFDNLSLSSKIRLWLNLRRVLSFVSF